MTTAQRHLKSCQAFYNGIDWEHCNCKEEILRDLYYLSGYILEALVVYFVYKRGGFSEKKDIDVFDKEFTNKTCVDYFPKRKNSEGKYETSRCLTQLYNGKKMCIEDIQWLNSKPKLYGINQHKFGLIIENCFDNLIFSSESIPYFSDRSKISKEARDLILLWDVKLRYSTLDERDPWKKVQNILNEKSLNELLSVCKQIEKAVNSVC